MEFKPLLEPAYPPLFEVPRAAVPAAPVPTHLVLVEPTAEERGLGHECVRCGVWYCQAHAFDFMIPTKKRKDWKCQPCKTRTRSNGKRQFYFAGHMFWAGLLGTAFVPGVGSVVGVLYGFNVSKHRREIPDNRWKKTCPRCWPHVEVAMQSQS